MGGGVALMCAARTGMKRLSVWWWIDWVKVPGKR